MATKTVQMPADLLAAIKGDGVLSDEQLRQLIEIEAESIGLTFDEAVVAAGTNLLPKTPIGFDIQALVRMLDALPSPLASRFDDD